VRAALGRGLWQIVAACRPLVATSTLPAHLLTELPAGALWPTPHSRLFEFGRTAPEAGWIDDVARAARDVASAGERVIAHADWRAEHLRFIDDRIVVAYDWDSLAVGPEPALVGSCAHAFTADWSHGHRAQAPSVDEARELVAAYEEARGRGFDLTERAACAAAFAYACAYTARCSHALGVDEREVPGTFQHLVHRHGRELLDLLA
jgi:aminoglycoside phosphotransferase (APT) family kinase protein